MNNNYQFIFDGECPFCNHFAELLEIKSQIKDITVIDGRKNPELIKELLDKGFNLDNGAILLNKNKIFHGSEAINTICNQIKNPSGNLIRILSIIFKSKKRTNFLFPSLLIARRLTLIAKGVSTSL